MSFEPSPYQRAIFDFIDNGKGSAIVEACAGSGKTTTIVQALERTPASASVLFCAFNKRIADELKTRTPEHIDVRTLHSLGARAIYRAIGRSQLDTDKTFKIMGAVVTAEAKKLKLPPDAEEDHIFEIMKGKYDVRKIIAFAKGNLIHPDKAEALSKIADSLEIEIDVDGIELVQKVYKECITSTAMIDFDDQIFLPSCHGWLKAEYDFVFVDEAQDLNRAQMKMVTSVVKPGGRIIAVGDRHQCHPAGTKIAITGGDVKNIEDLKIGDQVVSYFTGGAVFRGVASQGRKVLNKKKQRFKGDLIEITVGTEKVVCTPNHRVLCRLSKSTRKYFVFAMQKGQKVRIGMCKARYTRHTKSVAGIPARARSEKAERAWILAAFDTALEARAFECETSACFGLPQLTFISTSENHFPQKTINAIYKNLGNLRPKLNELLRRCGLEFDFPVWQNTKKYNHVGSKTFIDAACNLFNGVHAMKVFHGTVHDGKWIPISVRRIPFDGFVYGIEVEPTENNSGRRGGGKRLYVANNIVVHNSIYAFRGADSRAMDRIKEITQAEEFPLSISYRCPQKVIQRAQQLVPHIQTYEGALEGVVEDVSLDYLLRNATSGNYVLARTNATLMTVAFRLIRQGKKVIVLGYDVGKGLLKLIKDLAGTGEYEGDEEILDQDVRLLQKATHEWVANAVEKLLAQKKRGRAAAVQEKAHCLLALTLEAATVDEIVQFLKTVFSDRTEYGKIILSTIHKAKGLEADTVYVIKHLLPHPASKTEEDMTQEINLEYVAYTRSKFALYVVVGGPDEFVVDARNL